MNFQRGGETEGDRKGGGSKDVGLETDRQTDKDKEKEKEIKKEREKDPAPPPSFWNTSRSRFS